MMGTDERDLYWLAGIFEGEGSFCKGPPSKPHAPMMTVEMTDRDVIARVATLMGANMAEILTPAGRKTIYRVRVFGSRAVAWMQSLQPLMGERRRAQIDIALACYVVYKKGPNGGNPVVVS